MRPDLLASYWTISAGIPHTDHEYSPFDFKARVESAARAGFKEFGVWHADLEHILKHRSLEEMKHILDDNGIQHVELEFLTDWFLEDERNKQSDERKKMLLTAAEVLRNGSDPRYQVAASPVAFANTSCLSRIPTLVAASLREFHCVGQIESQ